VLRAARLLVVAVGVAVAVLRAACLAVAIGVAVAVLCAARLAVSRCDCCV
jgi:hypothetical protein